MSQAQNKNGFFNPEKQNCSYEELYYEMTAIVAQKEIKIKHLISERARLNGKIERRDEKIKRNSEESKELIKKLENQEAVMQEQEAYIAELEEKVAFLQAKLNRDSSNSSIPTGWNPDTPNKEKKHEPDSKQETEKQAIANEKSANEYNEREAKKILEENEQDNQQADTPKDDSKKPVRGGKPGHRGRTLTMQDLERLFSSFNVVFKVEDFGAVEEEYDSEYVLDIEVIVKVTENRYHGAKRNCKNPVIYGPVLKGLCVLLNTSYDLSYGKIVKLVKTITHNALTPSRGSIETFCKKFRKSKETDLKKLERDLLKEDILNTDSTVMIVSGVRKYIRVFCSDGKTFYKALDTKTKKEMRTETILKEYNGILIHDHETALYSFGKGHGECLVHTMRYLLKTYDETGHLWAWMMIKFYEELLHLRKQRIRCDKKAFSPEEISFFTNVYRKILETGYQENEDGKIFKFARDNEKTLLNRLTKYEESELLFLSDFRISPDNNLSERNLRACKLKQKTSGGLKTKEGLEMFAANKTIIDNIPPEVDILDYMADSFE